MAADVFARSFPAVSAVSVSTVSGSPKSIYGIPTGSGVLINPTVAGSAVVKCSLSSLSACQADVAGNTFSGGSAVWTDWPSGTVSAKTADSTGVPYTALALVVASGTWTMEVTS